MEINSLFEYFKKKEGKYLIVGENKKVLLLGVGRDLLGNSVRLNLYYKNTKLTSVDITKVVEELCLTFTKGVVELQYTTKTPIESFDSTLLIHISKLIEDMEEVEEGVGFKLLDWD